MKRSRYRFRKIWLFIPVLLFVVTGFLVFTESFISSLDGDRINSDIRRTSNIHKNLDLHAQSDEQHGIQQRDPRIKSISRTLGELPPRDIKELLNIQIPNIVFYLWCGNKTFEYNHYLSVLSVWTFIEPEILEIYYESEPLQDKYNDWLDILKYSIPNLSLKELPSWVKCDSCNAHIIDVLYDRGGIYIDTETILLNSFRSARNKPFTVFFANSESPKVVLSVKGNTDLRRTPCFAKPSIVKRADTKDNIVIKNCEIVNDHKSNITENKDCLILSQSIYPKDILTSNQKLATTLRFIAYSEREPLQPAADGTPIPKIVHYIWYNTSNMTFIMYLSMMSSLHVLKADQVYVHGGNALSGQYWDQVKMNPRVTSVSRETPRTVFGHQILYTHHKSDVIRGDILYKYGGIYVDWDVLWVRPVDDLISAGYDVIVNLDHMDHYPFPESINMGVVISKPRAKYIKMWRKTYEKYRKNDFYYNPIEVPYKIYERFPTSVKIEPRLQVMCYHLMCHPVFHPQYKDFQNPQPFDWRNDVYSVHLTFPDPEEYKDENSLRNGHGMFADIGKFILQSARPE